MTPAGADLRAESSAVRFELTALTPLLNVTQRQHWTRRRRQILAVAWHVKLALGEQRPDAPFPRARLRIERHSVGLPDYDGMVGGFKALIDCLLPFHSTRRRYGLGVIADDNPAVLMADYPPPFRVAHRAAQRVVVTIEQLA